MDRTPKGQRGKVLKIKAKTLFPGGGEFFVREEEHPRAEPKLASKNLFRSLLINLSPLFRPHELPFPVRFPNYPKLSALGV